MSIIVSAPSRVHFGLFSIGNLVEREFGGAGLMLKEPRCEIRIDRSEGLEIALPASHQSADLANRIEQHVQQWHQAFANANGTKGQRLRSELPHCRIELLKLPPQHSGLGTGTQLALAVHAGLSAFTQMPTPAPFELISAANRGKRSAIGSYGFFEGGFLIDRGKSDRDAVAPLDYHDHFPSWPIVLAISKTKDKVFGPAELKAFENLPPTQPAERERIVGGVRDRMVPALVSEDFDTFSLAVNALGTASGRLFEPVQGGIYNGPKVTAIVHAMRQFGIQGVGQSSWGPCVFGVVPDDEQAERLIRFLSAQFDDCEFIKTAADNEGAKILRTDSGEN